MAQIERRRREIRKKLPEGVDSLPALVSYLDSVFNTEKTSVSSPDGLHEYIRWYGHDDHKAFDVCADDHCQRYQGLTRAVGDKVRRAVDATWGEILTYGSTICDARFSKCCGGRTERFSVCWEDMDYPYLSSVEDRFCNTSDKSVLDQVLNAYDMETMDFYSWTQDYSREELQSLISEKSGIDIGDLLMLRPLARGDSGRIFRMEVIGSRTSFIVGKELEIRRILSDSHLKSSDFEITYTDAAGNEICQETVGASVASGRPAFEGIILKGRGWGHGVGLCQIGAAVMAEKGYTYREILDHYYSGAVLSSRSFGYGTGQ